MSFSPPRLPLVLSAACLASIVLLSPALAQAQAQVQVCTGPTERLDQPLRRTGQRDRLVLDLGRRGELVGRRLSGPARGRAQGALPDPHHPGAQPRRER